MQKILIKLKIYKKIARNSYFVMPPPTTPKVKKALEKACKRPSGRTCKVRRKHRPRRYQVPKGEKTKSMEVLARITTCFLCLGKTGATKKDPLATKTPLGVIEHLHRSLEGHGSGPVRGHTCRRCNRIEAQSLTETLGYYNLSRQYFTNSKNKLPDGFWKKQAELLAGKLPIKRTEKFLTNYLTGKFFEDLIKRL